MKEKTFLSSILLSAFFFHSILFSQSGWVQQNSGITQPISKISFIDANTGWCSASGGLTFVTWGFFIRTINGGQNWTTIISDITAYYSFHFANYNTGWLLGSYSDDVGKHARKIYKSTNGGLNWNIQFIDSLPGYLNSVHFVNENFGIAVGTTFSKGLIFRTTDSGQNWIRDSLNNVSSLCDIYYMYANTGWIVGGNNGQIFRTLDGGINWFLQYSASGITFYDIFFLDPITAWVAGTNGVIAKTTNSGNNWMLQNVGSNVPLYSIRFVTPDTGFAVGGAYYGPAYIFKTTNGGTNWFINFQQSGYNFNSVHFINNFTGWSAGGVGNPLNNGIIYKNTTGGTVGIRKIESSVPVDFILYQNYPNPFNPTTKIRFDIPALVGSKYLVKMNIYNILGEQVSELVNEELSPGTYEAEWDASKYSSGVYYYTIIAGDASAPLSTRFSQTKKMVLIK